MEPVKKKVVNEIADQLGIKNLKALHLRAEDCREKFHFIVSRTVCSLDLLIQYSKPLLLQTCSYCIAKWSNCI